MQLKAICCIRGLLYFEAVIFKHFMFISKYNLFLYEQIPTQKLPLLWVLTRRIQVYTIMILHFTIWGAAKKSGTSGRRTSRRFMEWCMWSIQLHLTEWMKSKRICRCYWRMKKLAESQFYCKFPLKFCKYRKKVLVIQC